MKTDKVKLKTGFLKGNMTHTAANWARPRKAGDAILRSQGNR
jgi:hypothetical protein